MRKIGIIISPMDDFFQCKKINSILHAATLLFCLGIFLFGLTGCKQPDHLDRILASGQIVAVMEPGWPRLYYSGNQPMGFEFELAKGLADYLGVTLRIITPDWDQSIPSVLSDKADFLAGAVDHAQNQMDQLSFSQPYRATRQYLITHRKLRAPKSLLELENKTIHVDDGSASLFALAQMRANGLDILIRRHKNLSQEEILKRVSDKTYSFAAAGLQSAQKARRFYPNLKILAPLRGAQPVTWAVSRKDTRLLQVMNQFLQASRKNGFHAHVYDKYFAHLDTFDYLDVKRFHRRIRTRLPQYKNSIQQAAEANGLDWRLIAAISYQESHFDPEAESFTGVRGIMQMTQAAASEMGVEDRTDPHQSIYGGVRYLKKLYMRFPESKNRDRILLALASYNVGYGHVLDAQALAEEMNLDPNLWSSLRRTLPLLRFHRYYAKSRYGYCRGTEPIRYVKQVMLYYDILARDPLVGPEIT